MGRAASPERDRRIGRTGAALLAEQPAEAVVHFHLRQEPLGVRPHRLRTIRSIAVKHQFGSIQQKLFRGYAGMDREKLKTGTLIEVEAKVHMLNLSAQQSCINRTVVTDLGDHSRTGTVTAHPAKHMTARP